MNIIITIVIAAFLVLYAGLFKAKKALLPLTLVGLLVALGFAVASWNNNTIYFGMMKMDNFALAFSAISIVGTFFIFLLTQKYFAEGSDNIAEYFTLILFALSGIVIMVSYQNLSMLFIGLEIMSVSLYILAGIRKLNFASNEASLKYFLMGAFSTGFLLFGITLIYGATGSFDIEVIQQYLVNNVKAVSPLFYPGVILIMIGLCFKVGAAPFHFWTPDVYDGAPTVFTSFMATIAKSAGFIAFINIYLVQYKPFEKTWGIILPLVIVSTLMVGNVTAVFQRSVKRMLTYSSIAQAGFMLFALYGSSSFANEGILLYMVVYSLASIGIFAVLVKMKENSFEAFHGLAKTHPLLAFLTTVFLCSLAGIPITGGFFAKYYMINAVLIAGAGIWLVVVAMIFASISVYYYFKLIQAMYFVPGTPAIGELDKTYTYKLAVIAVLILVLGVLPNLLFNYLYF